MEGYSCLSVCCLLSCAEGDKAKEATDFAVEYEHRASDKLKRPDVIDIVAKAVPQPPYKVSLSNPTRTILVQAVRNVAALSVVTSFKQLAKFNLRRLAEGEEDEAAEGAGDKAAAADGEQAAAAAAAADGEQAANKGEAADGAVGGEAAGQETAADDAQ
jgi:tRNA acetyltransferase TAN1